MVLSTRVLLLRSTERWKLWRKSAPRIGLLTSATTKIQGRERLSPKFRVRDFLPNVGICEPFAAWRLNESWGRFLSAGVGGRTLTAAPVSTRKVRWFVESCMCRRRLVVDRPGALVVASVWPASLGMRKEGCTCGLHCQISCGTNRLAQYLGKWDWEWASGVGNVVFCSLPF